MQAIETADRVRKRNKVRAAWISFAGRIAAQLIGAIATVTLGVIVLGKGPAAAGRADISTQPQPTVLVATPVRTHGETVIVMLPVGKDGKVDTSMAAEVAASYEKTKATPLADARRQTPTDRRAPLSAGPSADSRESLEPQRE